MNCKLLWHFLKTYSEVWIWRVIFEFASDPQNSFAIINHFCHTRPPEMQKWDLDYMEPPEKLSHLSSVQVWAP